MSASRPYLIKLYGPQAQKTFVGALEAFFACEFPQLAGERARRSIVQGIVEMVQRYFPETSHLRQGQVPWVTIAKDETAAYGKTISQSRMVPVTLSIINSDEIAERRDGKRLRDIKRDAVARVCYESDAQGGCITAAELALLFKTTHVTIGKYIKEWEQLQGKLLPRRGTIHDMGPTLTHKRDICKLLFIDGRTVQDTCLITKHSQQAVDRYITNFKQVFICKTKGLSVQETAYATKLSKRLIEEYRRLFDEYAVTSVRMQKLLSESPKP